MALWNPWHGCKKYSAGCLNCYVYRIDAGHGIDSSIVHKTNNFNLPIKRKRNGDYKISSGELVYTCFSSDFFIDEADGWRDEAWKMIRERSDLEFFFITKRIDRFYECIPSDWNDGYPNVTICCTMENQEMADYRFPIYKSITTKKKNIICEPLIGPIDFSNLFDDSIDKVTVGGESGDNARICDYEWVLSIRETCRRNNVPFHFKQTGAKFKKGDKVYNIPRKLQMKQAALAGIDLK